MQNRRFHCSTKIWKNQFERRKIGRKISLCDIGKEVLLKHKVFIKLYCDTKLSQLSRSELVDELKKTHELEDHELHKSDEHIREKLKKYQRTRNLIF